MERPPGQAAASDGKGLRGDLASTSPTYSSTTSHGAQPAKLTAPSEVLQTLWYIVKGLPYNVPRLRASDFDWLQFLKTAHDQWYAREEDDREFGLRFACLTHNLDYDHLTGQMAAFKERPQIASDETNLVKLHSQCWAAIKRLNSPPHWFQRRGVVLHLEYDEDDRAVLREVTAERTCLELAAAAHFYSSEGPRARDARPSAIVAKNMLSKIPSDLPVLERISHFPFFAADGSLVASTGYHAVSRTYLDLEPGFRLPPLPSVPSQEDISVARGLLLDETLGDFPFQTEADKANALALGLAPFARDLIAGPTPLHDVESPTPGTGKGLLVDALLFPSAGANVGIGLLARDDAEVRKAITAKLLEGHTVIKFDNVSVPVVSGTLAGALTAPSWSDRRLGESTTTGGQSGLPIRCTWVMTANNPTFSTENIRRIVRCRLVPNTERPWQREPSQFRHPSLLTWVAQHRPELVWAYLVLVQNWIACGRPKGQVVMGSYEGYATTIGGILEAAGVVGFLGNREALYEEADTEAQKKHALVESWWERFHGEPVKASDLLPYWLVIEGVLSEETLKEPEEVKEAVKRIDRRERTSFGIMLSSLKDQVIGDYRIVSAGKQQRVAQWKCVPRVPSVPECTLAIGTHGGDLEVENSGKGTRGTRGTHEPEQGGLFDGGEPCWICGEPFQKYDSQGRPVCEEHDDDGLPF